MSILSHEMNMSSKNGHARVHMDVDMHGHVFAPPQEFSKLCDLYIEELS